MNEQNKAKGDGQFNTLYSFRRSQDNFEGYNLLKKDNVQQGKARKNSFKVYHYQPYPGGLFWSEEDKSNMGSGRGKNKYQL